MSRFNVSAWALAHASFTRFLLVLLMVAGVYAYLHLGRAEDPDFTFKFMVVRVAWPGASAIEMEREVTDRIEKTLEETPWLRYTRSYSKPGEAFIFIALKDYTPAKKVPDVWYQVRKKIGDVRQLLPAGVQGPFFNDEFGDAFGNIYAFTADGFTQAELKDWADEVRARLLRIPDVAKIDLLGVQPQRIYIEISNRKMATLGVSPLSLIDTLRRVNEVSPAGVLETDSDRVRLSVTGAFDSVESIREVGINAGGRSFRLGDIARVWRGYQDPKTATMRFRGREAVGLAVSMRTGGDVLTLGDRLRAEIDQVRASLPAGIEVHEVSDQPRVVRSSINEFMRSLGEAIAIVLAVSFLALGMRAGLVVAVSIPLTLAVTFFLMYVFGIYLQRISLGALIIALGLLVDDAIIAVEMMWVKMQQGLERARAAAFAYTSTAFPMLTGTLVTAAGFTPVGFAKSAAGEYTFSIFAVVGIALLVSWLVAVYFIPWLGFRLLPEPKHAAEEGDAVYDRPFYRRFRAFVGACIDRRWWVIGVTVAAFVLSIAAFRNLVEKQFFPASARTELMIDLWLPQGASFAATETEVKKVERILAGDREIVQFVCYVGTGSPRFYLPLDQQLSHINFAQFVLLTKDKAARERVRARLIGLLAGDFPNLRGRVVRLENGPPVGYPVQFRISGPDPETLRRLAGDVADVMRANPDTRNVHFDWFDKTRTVRLMVDQDKARALGVTSQDLALALNSVLSGVFITQFREDDELIDVVARAAGSEREQLEQLEDLNVFTASGRFLPLSQIAHISFEPEEGVIWRRNRQRTITVRADPRDGVQAPAVTAAVDAALGNIKARLPDGYHIETGGTVEEASFAENSIRTVMPMMVVLVLLLLMIQLQSFKRTVLVVATAPLGLIGVTLALILFHTPFGFVANLGVIALSGMIMRNSVILVDQIEHDIREGASAFDAITGAATRRLRPILLTAAAAVLAMIPLSRSTFWGPMAIAIMGGLMVATALTLLFVPALYAAWFRVKRA